MCLWSYDNRWMFELKFSKGCWVAGCAFQSLIFLTTILMGCETNEMPVWIAFRIMFSLGSLLSCLILAVKFEASSKTKRNFWNHLELIVAILGTINFLLTWSLVNNRERSNYFQYFATLQILLYTFALAPTFFTFIGFFIIKFAYLAMAIVNPSYLIKIRNY